MSTYSVANAVNRNFFAAIPIVSWSGVGPEVSVTLYHNSGAVSADRHGLGEGWSVSYSDSLGVLVYGRNGQIMATADDGSADVYNWDSSTREWVSPPGVHD